MTLLRLLLLSLISTTFNLSLAAVRSEAVEAALKKDSFEFHDVEYPKSNPLDRHIRPKNKLAALNYKFHAWSEVIEGGFYPIYSWRKAENVVIDGVENERYVMDKVWDGDFSEEKFFAELNEEDRTRLMEEIQSGILVGGLTHTSAEKLKKDSEKFKLVLKRPIILKGTPKETAKPKVEAETRKVEKEEDANVAKPRPIQEEKRLIPPPPIPLTKDSASGLPIARPVPGKPHHVYRINPKAGEDTILSLEIENKDPNDKTKRYIRSGQTAEDPISKERFIVP